MIKVNLLPQKKRARRVPSEAGGNRDFVIGVVALAGAAAVVFFAVDQPRRSHLRDLRDTNDQLQQEINANNGQLKGYEELKKAAQEADERAKAINRLMAAKVVPANVLQELSDILTPNHLPTMTEDMAQRTGNGPRSDPNKRFDLTWDPRHVWMTSFIDKNGSFKIEGGAQAEVDVTQLSKRLAASAYFSDVAPASEQRVADKDSGVNYYKFLITGKVAY
jgi:Tfp pilus assembly protein PilN